MVSSLGGLPRSLERRVRRSPGTLHVLKHRWLQRHARCVRQRRAAQVSSGLVVGWGDTRGSRLAGHPGPRRHELGGGGGRDRVGGAAAARERGARAADGRHAPRGEVRLTAPLIGGKLCDVCRRMPASLGMSAARAPAARAGQAARCVPGVSCCGFMALRWGPLERRMGGRQARCSCVQHWLTCKAGHRAEQQCSSWDARMPHALQVVPTPVSAASP